MFCFLLQFNTELVSELASGAVEGVRRALNWESGSLCPSCASIISLSSLSLLICKMAFLALPLLSS